MKITRRTIFATALAAPLAASAKPGFFERWSRMAKGSGIYALGETKTLEQKAFDEMMFRRANPSFRS